MKLLEKYTNNILELFEIDHLDNIVDMAIYEGGIKLINKGNPWDFWWRVECLEEKYNPRLTFNQKKQLFLEMIEYYMKKGLLRFEGEAILSRDEYIDEDGEPKAKNVKSINFDKNASVDEIITWFDEYFPTEEMAQKQNQSYEHVINIWMYVYPPYAYWFWKDPEDPEDEGEWYKCD